MNASTENGARLGRMRMIAAGTAVAFLLSGCAGAAIEVAQGARAEMTYNENIQAARRGDVEAQYKVGSALCCSVTEGSSFYDTPQAVEWLCRAAAAGHTPAMRKIGRIYHGDVVEGVRLTRRLAQKIAGSSTNLAVSYAWLQMAATRGEPDASEEAQDVWKDMNAKQRSDAKRLIAKGSAAT
ncbi:sel1 repeat family protein, partial [bacterium]|nr:sel1 repeat family protein [bacterium]